jgi:hypothetical protein
MSEMEIAGLSVVEWRGYEKVFHNFGDENEIRWPDRSSNRGNPQVLRLRGICGCSG